MKKLLTKKQKAVLAQMTAKAYKRIQSQGCPRPWMNGGIRRYGMPLESLSL